MDEVDGPLLVAPNSRERWLADAHQTLPLLSLDAQTGRTVYAKHPLVVHNLPLSAQENGLHPTDRPKWIMISDEGREKGMPKSRHTEAQMIGAKRGGAQQMWDEKSGSAPHTIYA